VVALTEIANGFEDASAGEVKQIGDYHFEVGVRGEADQDGRNRQATWYYFRLEGAADREVTIDLVNLAGEYNYRPNRGAIDDRTPPVFSYDRKNWEHLTSVEYDGRIPRLRLRLRPERSPVWIAHVAPYTTEDLARLLREVSGHPHLKREVIGKSAGGRDLLLLTVTDPAAAGEKKVVWLMARQHSWESGTSWVAEGALRYLLSGEAAQIRRTTVFRMFPMADPDGVVRGGVRFNANGYDLNRNWDAVDPAKMPEIAAQRQAVLDWVDGGGRVDLFLTLHNTETAEYLEGPPEGGHAVLMERFFRILRETTTLHPTRPARHAAVSTTPDRKGRMTVNQGLYHDRKIPAFLMEQMIAHNQKLGRYPTVRDRLAFGAELVQAMAKAVESE
jgi:hypothetical protein